MAKTVLIIENDEDTRAIYAKALTHHGYEILMAGQGAEGVHLARTHTPDLVLLDLRMPVMDGFEAVRYLRSYQETQSIPICAVSAFMPDDAELEELGGMSFDCFILKPVDPRDIVAEIEKRIGPGDVSRRREDSEAE